MKRIIVKIGSINRPQRVWVADIKHLFYFKKKKNPPLPKFLEKS